MIIGLTGTAGSGKDTVADLMCELFDMHNYSTSDYVRAVTRFVFDQEPDFSPVRDQLFVVATALRELNQASTINIGVLQARERGFERQIISGIRSVGEANAVRASGGIIIGVDADPKVRYERITSRMRDAESRKTYEQFLEQDEHENKGVSGGDMRGIRIVVDEADVIINNEDTLEALKDQLRAKITPLIQR